MYPQGSKAFKIQIPATRLAMWLNDFEFSVFSVLWPVEFP